MIRAPILACMLGLSVTAQAQDEVSEPAEKESPWSYNLTVGSNFIAGNLYQIQLSGSGQLVHDRGRVHNRTFANGFRLWMRREGQTVLFGDDFTLGNLFTWRLGERSSLVQFTYLTWSRLHRIDLRLGAGTGPMWQLLDGEKQSFRVGTLAFVERTSWPGTSFNRSIDHVDGVLTIPRLTLLSDARLALPDTGLTLQYVGYLHVNPLDPGDMRGLVQGSVAVHIAGPLHVSLSGQLSGSTVVLEGVVPVDTRTTVGLTLSPPPRNKPAPPGEDDDA